MHHAEERRRDHAPARRRLHLTAALLERPSSLGFVLMLPGVLLLLVFMAYPFFLGIWLALTDSRIGMPGPFVGTAELPELLSDSIFRQTALNTFVYALVTVPFKLVLGLGLALVLNQKMPFRNAVRAGVLMPWIVPTALSSLGWFMLFDPVFSPFSWLLKELGTDHQEHQLPGRPGRPWPRSPWRTSGAASRSSGSRSWPGSRPWRRTCTRPPPLTAPASGDRFRHVTLPVIQGIVMITTLFSIIWTFSDFQLIYVLTKGGPANQTHIFGTYAYQVGLNATAIGQGAAIALYMFPILAVFATILLVHLRKED